MDKKIDSDGLPNLSKTPQVLSNPLGMLAHFSGLHTQSIPCSKKYLLF